jgi:hypothetical protein
MHFEIHPPPSAPVSKKLGLGTPLSFAKAMAGTQEEKNTPRSPEIIRDILYFQDILAKMFLCFL